MLFTEFYIFGMLSLMMLIQYYRKNNDERYIKLEKIFKISFFILALLSLIFIGIGIFDQSKKEDNYKDALNEYTVNSHVYINRNRVINASDIIYKLVRLKNRFPNRYPQSDNKGYWEITLIKENQHFVIYLYREKTHHWEYLVYISSGEKMKYMGIIRNIFNEPIQVFENNETVRKNFKDSRFEENFARFTFPDVK